MFARLFKTINLFRFVYRQTPQMPWTKVQILRTIEHDDEVKAKRSMYIAIVLSFKQNYFATVADKGNTYLIIIIGRSDRSALIWEWSPSTFICTQSWKMFSHLKVIPRHGGFNGARLNRRFVYGR